VDFSRENGKNEGYAHTFGKIICGFVDVFVDLWIHCFTVFTVKTGQKKVRALNQRSISAV